MAKKLEIKKIFEEFDYLNKNITENGNYLMLKVRKYKKK